MPDLPLDSMRLVDQFVLAANESRSPREWRSDRIGRWFLARHPRLPAIRLLSDAGLLGWILGYPITEEGRLLADGDSHWVAAETVESAATLEALIYSFGGRFAVALVGVRHPRFYLDPAGSLSAVYCAHQQLVASTPNLVPSDDLSLARVELARAIGIPDTEGQYPLDLTPRYGVERILPNHYLDLGNWATARHWPSEPLDEVASIEAAVGEIATIIKRNIGAVVAASPTYLPLTAGQDSRALLACAQGHGPKLDLYTLQIGDRGAAIDCDTAQRIARRFGLQHRVVPLEQATEADLEEYMSRISYASGEMRGWQTATMLKRLDEGHAILEGHLGELARGYWWHGDDSESPDISPERLIQSCLCPEDEITLERARRWLQGLAGTKAIRVLDLFYIEQDMGCWAGLLPYAECHAGFHVFPLNHRRIIELMLTLPTTYRRSGLLQRDIIAREWPALLDWPFNQFVGASHLRFQGKTAIKKVASAVRDPRRALRWFQRATTGSRP